MKALQLLLAFALLTLAACALFGDDPFRKAPPPAPEVDVESLDGCAEIEPAISTELNYLQYCEQASDCGQVLTGTSCGCTRNLVARADVETDQFYALFDLVVENECDFPTVSTCDCPPAEGFACVENRCTWNYLDSQ